MNNFKNNLPKQAGPVNPNPNQVGQKKAKFWRSIFGSTSSTSTASATTFPNRPKSKATGVFGSFGDFLGGTRASGKLAAVEPKKVAKGPRTVSELKKKLYGYSSLTSAEREKILETARATAGYKLDKDWQRKNVVKKLLIKKDNPEFSDVDRRVIKDVLK